jgi:molybdopterin-synthase adenylyltransferase
VSDACYYEGVPLVTGAIGEFDGSLTTLKPFAANSEGVLNPTYRCLFPEPPPPGTVPTCAEAGVLGAMAGALGSLMALEAIREIVGGFFEGDTGLVGKLLLVDARAMRFETLSYGWDEANVLSGSGEPFPPPSGEKVARSAG